MGRWMILTAAVLVLAGCSAGKEERTDFKIVYADASQEDAGELESHLNPSGRPVTVYADIMANAVSEILGGDADCGYGVISPDNGIQYGIAKGRVMKRRELVFLSKDPVTALDELNSMKLGYPEGLDAGLLHALGSAEESERHAYRLEEQMVDDLRSGLLDVLVLEQEDAVRIWQSEGDGFQLSSPLDAPKLEYRFFATNEEAVEYAQSIWEER